MEKIHYRQSCLCRVLENPVAFAVVCLWAEPTSLIRSARGRGNKLYERLTRVLVNTDDLQFRIDLARQTQKITKPMSAAQVIDHSRLDQVLAGK